jgi:hypothetical protein
VSEDKDATATFTVRPDWMGSGNVAGTCSTDAGQRAFRATIMGLATGVVSFRGR